MKQFLILIFIIFIASSSFSQIIEPIKEPSLVTFRDVSNDTFALININRVKNINEKLVYMYELMCVKDSLEDVINVYANLVNTKNNIIRLQENRITNLETLYKNTQTLLYKADDLLISYQDKVKKKNKVITALGVSTGAAAILLIGSLLLK